MTTFVAKSLLAIGLSLAVLAAPAIAQSPINTAGQGKVTIEFRYKGWDTPAENYKNMRRVAKRACATPGPKLMIARISEDRCVAALTDGAVAGLRRQAVTQLHFAATGRLISPGLELASADDAGR
jgi:hypothetical protein